MGRITLMLLAVIVSRLSADAGGDKRPVTVEDCVSTRRVLMEETRLSPRADQVAYVVKAPDVTRNRNVFKLYLRALDRTEERSNGRLLFESASIRELKWLPDDREVLCLTSDKSGKTRVIRLNVANGRISTVVAYPGIEDYSTDSTGQKVVFSVIAESDHHQEDQSDDEKGYSIAFGKPRTVGNLRDPRTTRLRLFMVGTGESARPKEIHIHSGIFASPILNLRNLNLSPDGKVLLFHCRPDHLPQGWDRNPVAHRFIALGMNPPALGLYEMETGRARLAINAPDPHYQTLWSADGKAFAVNSVVPIGSPTENNSPMIEPSVKITATGTHIFAVDAVSGAITLVLPNPESEEELPLWWIKAEGPMLVRADKKTVVELKMEGEKWGETGRFVGQSSESVIEDSGTSNGRIEIASAEQPVIPPDLMLTDIITGKSVVLTDLNSEYRHIALGSVSKVEWKNKFYAQCTGYLIKPPDYREGRKYPLVIMAKGWDDSFLSDTSYRTAFPPQVLADSGFLVLLVNAPSAEQEPREYPGHMGEAINWMEMVLSGISLLSDQGLIDEKEVGIMGFSRTSWLVDFMLTHSKFKFAAASSADSGAYNYGTYWLANDELTMQAFTAQYGGPPYGESFRNWLAYAPAFNAQNVMAPLLMEYTECWLGYEPLYAHEFFVALRSAGKPVDLFYYPRGQHELDTPGERIASLQRNVDWFRFWMQGYERPDPGVGEQYRRWRSLKAEQTETHSAASKDSI